MRRRRRSRRPRFTPEPLRFDLTRRPARRDDHTTTTASGTPARACASSSWSSPVGRRAGSRVDLEPADQGGGPARAGGWGRPDRAARRRTKGGRPGGGPRAARREPDGPGRGRPVEGVGRGREGVGGLPTPGCSGRCVRGSPFPPAPPLRRSCPNATAGPIPPGSSCGQSRSPLPRTPRISLA